MPVVLGVTGFKGSGKSEIRKYLVRSYGFTVIPMAEPLKSMLKAVGLNDDQLHGHLKEVPAEQLSGVTPRLAMQTLGTEWGRMMIHTDLWVNIWRARAINCKTPVVADDVRFGNELQAVKSLGGKVLRVTREGQGASDHPSELEMADLDVDYTIPNNSKSLLDLHKAVDRALQLLKLKG